MEIPGDYVLPDVVVRHEALDLSVGQLAAEVKVLQTQPTSEMFHFSQVPGEYRQCHLDYSGGIFHPEFCHPLR